MTKSPVRVALRMAAFTACLALSACAGSGMLGRPAQGQGAARTSAGEPLSPAAASERVVPGRSTKADVAAALGKAIVVAFDSGYEVWVYRWPGADETTRAATELVVLFDPAGVATKLRVRPGYPARR